ncbi:MAG: hypothetical protein PW791_02355 [Neorhizobium sp.]|jgi:hypothetical protein|nr:hypothetical protein [Neorhizobium sp.]
MTELETNALKLARRYVELGGRRRSKLDDNIVSTRLWQDEPEDAKQFWETQIASLTEENRREVETHLPTMNYN